MLKTFLNDEEIANDIQDIFKIGGDGSHFNGKVKEEELQLIIEKAIHIVENIFVKYLQICKIKVAKCNFICYIKKEELDNQMGTKKYVSYLGT